MNSIRNNFKRFLVALVLVIVVQHISAYGTENNCLAQDTCERCLAAHINCTWCTDKHYDIRYRCLTRSKLLELGCNENNIYENEPVMHMLKDAPLKDYETVDDRAVQVQPQKFYIKLVKGNPQPIKFTYRPARNNPLDLYVLMDLTYTMRDDKETLAKLGVELTQTLRNLTSNYRLGFGSFADKPAMPMIMLQLKENPCAAERDVCEPTYGFKHHLKLTENVNAFIKSVDASRITGNLDNLEGGLDALMQVMVCPEEIGWKPEARKIVILVTDGFMHFAGDGLLAGITKRNDKQCHLSEDGEYLGSLEFDYPSLEEIYRELLRRKINVIFAVTAGVVNTYRDMSNLMKEISNVEILSADSSNILKLIEKSYERLIQRTQFTDNSPSFIKLDYETDCGGQFETLRKRNYCNNIKMGQPVDFQVSLTLTDFPTDGGYTRKIRIEESSLNEFIDIEVEIQKACPCAEADEPDDELGRFFCSENGYLRCGMCQCDNGWTGTFCSCPTDPSNATTNDAIEMLCRQQFKNPPESGPICSNHGECDCGTCNCDVGWEGTYCECPQCDVSCDPERADCFCGQCVCKYGWSGNRCSCKESTDGCIGPNGEICSNRGYCECGSCACDEPYVGRFCEIGAESDNKLCTFYEPCVACLIQQKLDEHQCDNLTEICSAAEHNERFTHTFVEEEIEPDQRCLVRLENRFGVKCDHYFSYTSLGQAENYLVIQINSCEPVSMLALIGGLSIGTFLLGLLVLLAIWCCVRMRDAREYARFENDKRNTMNMENPLYENPIRQYNVPKSLHPDDNPFR